jgi:hypothetical protein
MEARFNYVKAALGHSKPCSVWDNIFTNAD